MKKIFLTLSVIVLSCAPNGQWKTKTQDTDCIHRTVKQVTDVIVHDIFSPPVASRIYSYMCVAGYEAGIHSDRKFVSLAGQINGLEPFPQPEEGADYCYPLASIQAMLKVGKALVFSEDKIDEFYEKIMDEFRESGVPDEVFERSIAYGDSVAGHVMKWAGKDNYKQSRSFPKFSIENNADTWKPTPPAYIDAIEPHWNKIRTLALDSANQFTPVAPPAFSTDAKSEFYKHAREVYDVCQNLTPDQKAIASFWDCNPFMMNVRGHVMFATKKISPGGHWMNITAVACKKQKLDFVSTLEAYAKVSITLFDGFISCWDEKYRSKVIRPETYINQYIDEDWFPVLQTPPFPEYTSGHSVISTASALTLTKIFGDNFSYTDSTEIEFGLPARTFSSFNAAAEEAAISRMYGGIHYRPAIEEGMVEGRALGDFIFQKIKTRREDLAHAN
jgi:hypothetical protein